MVCTFLAMLHGSITKLCHFQTHCTLPSNCTGQLQPTLEQVTNAYIKVFLALAVSTQADTLEERERNVLINYKTDTKTGAKG